MQKYVLMRIENDTEVMTMQCDSLESARKQGCAFKEGYTVDAEFVESPFMSKKWIV